MSLLTGRDGALRIYDSSNILLGAAPRDEATVDVVTWDGSSSWANITSDVDTDDTSYSSNFLTDNDDAVFIGADVMFAMIRFIKGGASDYAAASGNLKAYYFDGTNFDKTLTFTDGTSSGGNCFAQDGNIGFNIPSDWAVGANTVNANLDADKYYVKLMTTTSSTTDPDADVLCPCDGQYFEVAFAQMDFSGPIGRALTDERLILDRQKAGSRMHFIEQADNKLYEPLPVSFAALLDTTYNKDDLEIALQCGNPGSARWTAAGTSSKGDTQNDGSNSNPTFADSNKKTVNIQYLASSPGSGVDYGWAYYECYFPPDEQSYQEGEDGNVLSLNGGCYGLIKRIHGFGIRY